MLKCRYVSWALIKNYFLAINKLFSFLKVRLIESEIKVLKWNQISNAV